MSRKTLGIALIILGVILLLIGLFALTGVAQIALIVIGGIAILIGLILLFTGQEAVKEDLTRIEGIGPKLQEILYAAGITNFSALAGKAPDKLVELIKATGFTAPFDPASWAEQAGLAAKGDWDALQALQDKLTGGRAE